MSAYDEIICRFGRAMHLVDITPEMAAEWLATLPPSAKPDEGKVARFAQMMLDGSWECMEMPVVYRNGRLLSSRNRMAAIVRAGVMVSMYVSDDYCPR